MYLLNPVYMHHVEPYVRTPWSIYGIQGMIYGLGAIVAGISVPILARKIGDEKTIVFEVITYTLAISFDHIRQYSLLLVTYVFYFHRKLWSEGC